MLRASLRETDTNSKYGKSTRAVAGHSAMFEPPSLELRASRVEPIILVRLAMVQVLAGKRSALKDLTL